MRVSVSLVVLLSGLAALVAAVAVSEPTLMVRQGNGKGKGGNGGSPPSSASETSMLSILFLIRPVLILHKGASTTQSCT